MAFDRTDPADLLALKNEVNTDPISMNYAPVVGNTTQLLKLLNDPANNVGGETAAGELTPAILVDDIIEPDDLTPGGQFSQGKLEWLKIAMEITQRQDDDVSHLRTKLESIFAANTTTGANLRALTRTLSRAEVLFGQNTVINRDDWIAARDS